jgi:hypothetical protein
MHAPRKTRSAVAALAIIVSLVLIGGTVVAGEAPFRATGHATLVGVDRPYEFISVTGARPSSAPSRGCETVRNFGHTTVATTTLVGRDGGTGRFEGAIGYGVESVGAFDPAIGARVLTWDGVIDF